MPYVKQISVHKSPLKMLQYILNGDKNSDMKYASELNCVTDTYTAYKLFEKSFESNTGERFFVYDGIKSKNNVRIHHYVQSFSPEENITPEEAHQIGMEWAKKIWGNNRMVICSTHLDKGHIHNHFAVAPYSYDGVKWHSNIKTLNTLRKVSDEIALQHGISIIKNPNRHGGIKYKEWIENRQGSSWKTNLRIDIDNLIVKDNVNSLDDLLEKLKEQGYSIKVGKYITIRPQNYDRGVRSYRLGNGYSEQDLIYRIQNKDKEISVDAILSQYKGIQVEYAFCLRQVQMLVYHKQPNPDRLNIRHIQQTSSVLTWLSNNNVHSINDFKSKIENLNKEADEYSLQISDINAKISAVKKLVDDYDTYENILNKLPDVSEEERQIFLKVQYAADSERRIGEMRQQLSELNNQLNDIKEKYIQKKKECRDAEKMWDIYNQQIKDDYTLILEQVRAEQEDAERLAEQQRQEEINNHTYYYDDKFDDRNNTNGGIKL